MGGKEFFKLLQTPPAKKRRRRKRGGQLGNKKFSRDPFTPDQIDKTIIHELSVDEIRRKKLTPLNETETALQQIEVPDKLYNVIEHRVRLYQKPNGGIVKATLPNELLNSCRAI